MSRVSKDFTAVVGNLAEFLTSQGWVQGRERAGLKYYDAPESVGVTSNFSIALPSDPRRPGIDKLILSALNTLGDIYDKNLNELYEEVAATNDLTSSTTLSVRFVDEKTSGGVIPLPSISAFVQGFEKSLYEAIKFKMGDASKSTVERAQRFLRDCAFLQTAPGSFIARVEVPAVMFRQAQLLPDAPPPLASSQVCASMFSAIEFLNDRILQSSEDYESIDLIAHALELFNPELLDALSKVLVGAEVSTTEFGMEIGDQIRTTSTGNVTPENTGRLKEYVKFIRDHLHGVDVIDVQGSIVELRSRDPQGNRNHIGIATVFNGDRTFVTATLNNEQYDIAMTAHRAKGAVRLKGRGMQLKTQLRVTDIEVFETTLG